MAVHWTKESKAKAARESGYDLTNWLGWSDRSNITGKLPKLQEKLGGSKTNAELAAELSKKLGKIVSARSASKWRNHKIEEPVGK